MSIHFGFEDISFFMFIIVLFIAIIILIGLSLLTKAIFKDKDKDILYLFSLVLATLLPTSALVFLFISIGNNSYMYDVANDYLNEENQDDKVVLIDKDDKQLEYKYEVYINDEEYKLIVDEDSEEVSLIEI